MGELLEGSDAIAPMPTVHGFPRQRPSGLRHAVPAGQALALCGARPALVWAGSQWPDADHPDELCQDCRRLSLDYVRPREAFPS